ncbi:B3 domain-containing transcription factor VRN1-like isoform X2 [Papaver somniferum]|nr:B3 domain-containing transcription factor VRN1-like isoform X2 [Papaver somniferum]
MVPYDSILQSPSGCWNVEIREEEDGGLSFWEGWPDFVQAHCLGQGDFVTMKYIGNSQFAVMLYGKNGCEKVLPSSTGNNGVKSIPSRKRKEYGETSKRQFTNSGSGFDQHKYHAGDTGGDSLSSGKKKCALFKCGALKRKSTLIEGRIRVDQEECSGKGKPCFRFFWTENKKYRMEIPQKVLRKIGRTLSDIVALKSANGKLWNVELKRSGGKVWFYKGWKEFTEHLSLRDGYVLGISYNGNSHFDVRITNYMDDSVNQGDSNPKKRCRLSKREEDDDVIRLDSPPSRPHVESKTYEERAQLSVPPGFNTPMQLNKNKGAKSLVSDETRCVGNERTPSGYRLPVVKEVKSEDTSDSPEASRHLQKLSWRAGKERVAEVTKLFKPQTHSPFFAVCMRDTYLTYPYLHIPYNFANKHLRKTIKNVVVRNSEDRVWTLGYWMGDSSAQLCSGWTSLRRDLRLTEGDVCVFELLKGKDTEMRVSVFRKIDNVLTRI